MASLTWLAVLVKICVVLGKLRLEAENLLSEISDDAGVLRYVVLHVKLIPLHLRSMMHSQSRPHSKNTKHYKTTYILT